MCHHSRFPQDPTGKLHVGISCEREPPDFMAVLATCPMTPKRNADCEPPKNGRQRTNHASGSATRRENGTGNKERPTRERIGIPFLIWPGHLDNRKTPLTSCRRLPIILSEISEVSLTKLEVNTMATLAKRMRGNSLMFEIRFYVDGQRKTIPLGSKYTERTATELKGIIETLLRYKDNGESAPDNKNRRLAVPKRSIEPPMGRRELGIQQVFRSQSQDGASRWKGGPMGADFPGTSRGTGAVVFRHVISRRAGIRHQSIP